jgi:hypothetical protein
MKTFSSTESEKSSKKSVTFQKKNRSLPKINIRLKSPRIDLQTSGGGKQWRNQPPLFESYIVLNEKPSNVRPCINVGILVSWQISEANNQNRKFTESKHNPSWFYFNFLLNEALGCSLLYNTKSRIKHHTYTSKKHCMCTFKKAE